MSRLAATTLAVLLAAPTARAYCRTTTSRAAALPGGCATTGVPLAWRNLCTSYSLFRTNIPPEIALPDLDSLASTATGAWGRVACDDNGREPQYYRIISDGLTSQPTGYDPAGSNANTVSFRTHWNDDALHRSGTIAITVVTFDALTGEIFDADIEMNRRTEQNPGGFVFAMNRVPGPDECDLRTILTHEVGHCRGRAHSPQDRAVMYPTAGLGEVRSDLTSDDAAGICSIYPERNAPPGLCVGVPYGGLATVPGGDKVRGASCSMAPGGTSRSLGVFTVLTLAVCFGRRRERRATLRS